MSRVGERDKTRGGIKGSALMQSCAHLSTAGGGGTTRSPAITLSFKTEAQRGRSLQPRHGDEWNKPVKFDEQNSS